MCGEISMDPALAGNEDVAGVVQNIELDGNEALGFEVLGINV